MPKRRISPSRNSGRNANRNSRYSSRSAPPAERKSYLDRNNSYLVNIVDFAQPTDTSPEATEDRNLWNAFNLTQPQQPKPLARYLVLDFDPLAPRGPIDMHNFLRGREQHVTFSLTENPDDATAIPEDAVRRVIGLLKKRNAGQSISSVPIREAVYTYNMSQKPADKITLSRYNPASRHLEAKSTTLQPATSGNKPPRVKTLHNTPRQSKKAESEPKPYILEFIPREGYDQRSYPWLPAEKGYLSKLTPTPVQHILHGATMQTTPDIDGALRFNKSEVEKAMSSVEEMMRSSPISGLSFYNSVHLTPPASAFLSIVNAQHALDEQRAPRPEEPFTTRTANPPVFSQPPKAQTQSPAPKEMGSQSGPTNAFNTLGEKK